jgi:hypothetical protein
LGLVVQPDPRLLDLALQSDSLKLESWKFNIIINIINIIFFIINIIIFIIMNIANIIIDKFEENIINIEKQP